MRRILACYVEAFWPQSCSRRSDGLDEEEEDGYWKENVRLVEGCLGSMVVLMEHFEFTGCFRTFKYIGNYHPVPCIKDEIFPSIELQPQKYTYGKWQQ